MHHFEKMHRKTRCFLRFLNREKITKISQFWQKGGKMKTGLTKRQKDTVICFNEESDIIDVRTHNTDLRNRLLEFSEKYPDCCKLTDDDEQG